MRDPIFCPRASHEVLYAIVPESDQVLVTTRLARKKKIEQFGKRLVAIVPKTSSSTLIRRQLEARGR